MIPFKMNTHHAYTMYSEIDKNVKNIKNAVLEMIKNNYQDSIMNICTKLYIVIN